MKKIMRVAAAALAVLAMGPAAAAFADDEDGGAPIALTGASSSVTHNSAVLGATVTAGEDGRTYYRFEYGKTANYGSQSATASFASGGTRTVSAAITGLSPGTTYHFRVRAWDDEGTSVGSDRTFTTGTVGQPPASGPDDESDPTDKTQPAEEQTDSGDGQSAVLLPDGTTASPPEMGRSVVVAPVAGKVMVKLAGSGGFALLGPGDEIPVGSIVDTRDGTVQLSSSLPDGRTQTGEFRGALFEVRQASSGNGMTDLVLRGGDFGACRRAGVARARAAGRRKPPTRRLWGKDDGGRFRTHGRDSVATVRGTSWVTTDTCAGTRTTVTEGAVAVRDLRRNKTVLVRAGRSYLARSAR